MKKQLLFLFSLLAFSFTMKSCEAEYKKRLKDIFQYYNQEITNIRRSFLGGKSYLKVENAPDLNFLEPSQKYTFAEIFERLRIIEKYFLTQLDKSSEFAALAVQEVNDEGFLDVAQPESSLYKGLSQKIKEVQFMIDLLKELQNICPQLFEKTWTEWASSWAPKFTS